MIRAFVVDDEKLTADLIGRYLEATGKVKVERIICNPLEVIEEVDQAKPDVVFLDIEMPGITGLELAENITAMAKHPEVVFITAHSSYALEAFKVNALDYVVKPIDPHELERVIKKIANRRPHVDRINILRVNSLGSFTVVLDSKMEPIKWSTAKCEELFAYMVLNRESTAVSKWKLIDVLWPEKDERKSEINLRSTISRVNKTLRDYGANSRIISHNNGYRLASGEQEVDAFQLEVVADQWLKGGQKSSIKLQEFYKLYPGHLFADQDYSWAERFKSYFLRLFINFGKAMVNERIARGEDMNTTYQMLEYIIDLDPYDEDLREMAISILYKTEGKTAVVEYYLDFERQMVSQLGVDPKQSIKELYQRLVSSQNEKQ